MFDLLGTFALILVVVLCGWLARRAWASRNRLLKSIAAPIALLLSLVLTLALVIGLVGFIKMSAPPNHPVSAVKVASTSEQVARGQYLARVLCASCHSTANELPLSGGKNISDDVGLPLGSLYASNLTLAGDLQNWSDGEILRALRWGLHRSGRQLAMPVKATSQLSDADAQALVAYLRSQPAVETRWPGTSPSLLLGILIGANQFDLSASPDTGPISAPARDASAEYGQYVVSITDCRACHGEDLSGGKPPAPQGPSLSEVKVWTQEQFVSAIRTGVLPDGDTMEDSMPWKTLAKMDDVDLEAMYVYLRNAVPQR